MLSDILTIARKEWKEYLAGHGKRGGMTHILILVVVFGGFLPAQMGRTFMESPTSLLFWSWLPAFLVIAAAADSFAGERERHTLETLFATRLSDRALLFGKLTGIISYGWGLTLLCLLVGLVSINLAHGGGKLILPGPEIALAVLVVSFLVATLTGNIGVLLSMKSMSMRQVYQAMSITWLILIFGVSYGVKALLRVLSPGTSEAVVRWFTSIASSGNWIAPVAIVAAVLLAVACLLFWIAERRMKRVRTFPA